MKKKILPQWAPRIKKHKIQRLYKLDTQGIYDDELLAEVGYGIRARCQSFLEATQATEGNAPCPVCGNLIPHNWDKSEILNCDNCGWELSWGDYFSTIQKKQLSGAEPVREIFRCFIEEFPKAKTAREQMFLIDRVLHQFHYSLNYDLTRPVAINLVEGRLRDVIEFLDQLSYGPDSTPGICFQRDEWVTNSQYARGWGIKSSTRIACS
jgi:ribosomal protein L37AE/L43A